VCLVAAAAAAAAAAGRAAHACVPAQSLTASLNCTVTGVASLEVPPAAAVFGVATVAWAAPPTERQVRAATARAEALVAALEEATEAQAPFCGCAGDAPVSAGPDSPLAYVPVAGSGLPGVECAARLSATAAVGIFLGADDDRRRRALLAEGDGDSEDALTPLCSSPGLLEGGVLGVPTPDVLFDDQPRPECLGPMGVWASDLLAGEICPAYDFVGLPEICAPLAFDTFARLACSTPALGVDTVNPPTTAAGVLGVPGVGTCGVESTFRAGADGPTAACLLLLTAPPSDGCGAAPGAALNNVPCMPITNANENANENTNTLSNDNTNLAENTNSQTVENEATGGVSGDSASSSASNPNTAVGNPISIGVGTTGR
jgi:hypothetical protein